MATAISGQWSEPEAELRELLQEKDRRIQDLLSQVASEKEAVQRSIRSRQQLLDEWTQRYRLLDDQWRQRFSSSSAVSREGALEGEERLRGLAKALVESEKKRSEVIQELKAERQRHKEIEKELVETQAITSRWKQRGRTVDRAELAGLRGAQQNHLTQLEEKECLIEALEAEAASHEAQLSLQDKQINSIIGGQSATGAAGMKEELAGAMKRIAAVSLDLEGQKDLNQKQAKELDRQKRHGKQLEDDLRHWQAQHRDAQKRIADLEGARAALQAKQDHVRDHATEEREQLQQMVAKAKEQLRTSEQQVAESKLTAQECKEELLKKQDDMEELQLLRTRGRSADARALQQMQTNLLEAQNELHNKASLADELSSQATHQEELVNEYLAKHRRASDQLRSRMKEMEELQEAREDLVRELLDSRNRIEELEIQQLGTNDRAVALKQEQAEKSKQLLGAESIASELSSRLREQEEQLSAQQQELQEIHRLRSQDQSEGHEARLRLRAEIQEAKLALEERTSAAEAISSEVARQEQLVSEYKAQLHQASEQIRAKGRDVEKLQSDCGQLTQQLEDSRRRNEELQVQKRAEDNAALAMQLDLIEAIDAEEQQRGALHKLRERGRTDDIDEIHLLRHEQQELVEELAEAEQRAAELSTRADNQEKQLVAQKEEMHELELLRSQNHSEDADARLYLHAEIAETRAALEDAAAKVQSKEQDIQRLHAEREDLTQQLQECRQRNEDMEVQQREKDRMAMAAMQIDLIEAIEEEEQQRGALRKLRERGRTDDVDEIHLLRQEQAELLGELKEAEQIVAELNSRTEEQEKQLTAQQREIHKLEEGLHSRQDSANAEALVELQAEMAAAKAAVQEKTLLTEVMSADADKRQELMSEYQANLNNALEKLQSKDRDVERLNADREKLGQQLLDVRRRCQELELERAEAPSREAMSGRRPSGVRRDGEPSVQQEGSQLENGAISRELLEATRQIAELEVQLEDCKKELALRKGSAPDSMSLRAMKNVEPSARRLSTHDSYVMFSMDLARFDSSFSSFEDDLLIGEASPSSPMAAELADARTSAEKKKTVEVDLRARMAEPEDVQNQSQAEVQGLKKALQMKTDELEQLRVEHLQMQEELQSSRKRVRELEDALAARAGELHHRDETHRRSTPANPLATKHVSFSNFHTFVEIEECADDPYDSDSDDDDNNLAVKESEEEDEDASPVGMRQSLSSDEGSSQGMELPLERRGGRASTAVSSVFDAMGHNQSVRTVWRPSVISSFDEASAMRADPGQDLAVEVEVLLPEKPPKRKNADRFTMDALGQVQKAEAFKRAARTVHVKSWEVLLGRLHSSFSPQRDPDVEADDEDDPAAAGRQLLVERQASASEAKGVVGSLMQLCEDVVGKPDLTMLEKGSILEQVQFWSTGLEEEALLLAMSFEDMSKEMPVALKRCLCQAFASGSASSFASVEAGFTPLHWAAAKGRPDLAEYLLSLRRGAGLLKARDEYGCAPLAYALANRQVHMILRMQEAGATVSSANRPTVPRPEPAILPAKPRELFAQVEACGWAALAWRKGRSLLHWAAQAGHEELCAYLVQLNANPLAKDSSGRTAMDYAEAGLHVHVAACLHAMQELAPSGQFERSCSSSVSSVEEASGYRKQSTDSQSADDSPSP